MTCQDPNLVIWERSRALSQPFWSFYHQALGPSTYQFFHHQPQTCLDDKSSGTTPSPSTPDNNCCIVKDSDNDLSQQYLEFIQITRKHQAEREKLKRQQLKKKPELVEPYYKDISQVNTLVEDNLVEVPERNPNGSILKRQLEEDRLIKSYGSREVFEEIRSMEMSIDDLFRAKCQELKPEYWPVMPINPKPYLNPIMSGDS